MATPYPGNVSPVTQPAQDSAAAPIIRTIGLSDLHDALRLGWEDFKAVPSHAIMLCVIYPVLGLVLRVASDRDDRDVPLELNPVAHPDDLRLGDLGVPVLVRRRGGEGEGEQGRARSLLLAIAMDHHAGAARA